MMSYKRVGRGDYGRDNGYQAGAFGALLERVFGLRAAGTDLRNAFFAFTVVLTMREGCSLFQSNTVKYVYVARKAGRTACDQRTVQIIAAGNREHRSG